MLARIKMVWVYVRDSLWFIPGALTLLAAGLAFGVTEADRAGFMRSTITRYWIFGGGVEGARGVLSAIAGSLITVTGVVFSVTIVALQLASSQFTPRLLRDFTADRSNQVVLGVFISTFTYTLLVLRTVRSGGQGAEGFVPRIGVTLAVILVLVSIGCLIYFINHSARSIQASAILERVASRTLDDVLRLFPERIGEADPAGSPDPRRRDEPSAAVTAAESGYLQAVDARHLFDLGAKLDIMVGMEPRIGAFVLAGEPLASVSPPSAAEREEVQQAIRTAFVLGPERTPEQDVEFGIIEISDIALKALSPGINDPTTAFHCVDRLSEILLELGTRAPPEPHRTREGHVHYVARFTSFERAVGLAFDQIRHFGSDNPAMVNKLLELAARLSRLVPPHRRAPLVAQAEALLRDAQEGIRNPVDRAAVQQAAARLGL